MKERKTKKEIIEITLSMQSFDRACERAYDRALDALKIDEYGYCHKYPKIPRSSYALIVDFKGYRHIGNMGGQQITYTFEAYLSYNEDND